MTDWRDSPTARGVRAWERDEGDTRMSLEEWLQLNYAAAVRLYQTRRMGLLTDDPYYLRGEATGHEAMVLLLQHQLTHKNMEDLTRASRNHRELREGTRPKVTRLGTYKGVCLTGKGWRAQVSVGDRRIVVGHYTDPREAALAWDAYVTEHYPGRVTNAQLGLL